MRIAVTGGCGFIGQRIVEDLVRDEKNEVTVVDYWDDLIPRYEAERFPIVKRIYGTSRQVKGMVRPEEFLTGIRFHGPQVIVHAGACVDTMDMGAPGSQLWYNNVDYTRRLTSAASEAGAHMVFISSAAVYGTHGHPVNPYALSKVLGEKYVNAMKTRTSILRLFNVFGEFEHHKGKMASVPFKLAQAYRTGERFDMHSPDASRDFVPVGNVSEVVCREADRLMGPFTGEKDELPYYHSVADVGTASSITFAGLDAMIGHAKGILYSCVRTVDMPTGLAGRFQGFTEAGIWGTKTLTGSLSTAAGVKEYYGYGRG